MHANVHCNALYSSQDMEATFMSIDRWMDKERECVCVCVCVCVCMFIFPKMQLLVSLIFFLKVIFPFSFGLKYFLISSVISSLTPSPLFSCNMLFWLDAFVLFPFLFQSASLCLLIGTFSLLTFKVVTDKYVLIAILLFSSCSFHSSLFVSSFCFYLMWKTVTSFLRVCWQLSLW